MSNKMQKVEDEKTESAPEKSLFKFLFYFWLLIATIIAGIYLFSLEESTSTVSKVKPAVVYDKKCLNIDGECKVNMKVADTDEKRIKGLSGKDYMPENYGMLFTETSETFQCFWMQGMKFGLDFVWLDGSKKVIALDTQVAPETYPNQYCHDGVQYVIELKSGVVQQLGITTGQQLEF